MYDLMGKPVAEVAAALGRSEGAVYLLRVRAHRRLADILGAKSRGPAERTATVKAGASDREALLVDFLNELLLLHETEEAAFGGIRVTRLAEGELDATVELAPLAGEPETTGVKAATYHQLEVRETGGGFEARVYLDV